MLNNIIKNISKHVSLSADEIELLTSFLTIKKLRKRQYLLQAGDICKYETFVSKGLLKAYSVDAQDNEHILMFGLEDWWISDLYSFITESPSTMHIEALEDCELICLDRPALESLYQQIPKFERLMRILFQNAFVAQQQRILAAISQSAEERYAAFLKKYPSLEQRIPQTMIASYLGMTPETLSRIRKQWAN